MSEEYGKSKEVGKQLGKAFSKLINITSAYCDIAVNTITSAYSGFTEETKNSIKRKNNPDDINTYVEEELQNVDNKDKAEL